MSYDDMRFEHPGTAAHLPGPSSPRVCHGCRHPLLDHEYHPDRASCAAAGCSCPNYVPPGRLARLIWRLAR